VTVTAQRSAPRRSRRTQDEIRALLLRTACERFAHLGYVATPTRMIAAEAQVSERLIFSYFGSKAGLFEAAVLEPFRRFIEEYIEHWRDRPRSPDLVGETRTYIAGMYDLFDRNAGLVRALAGGRPADGVPDAGVGAAFGTLLAPIEDLVVAEVGRRGPRRFDPPLQARAMLGVVMATAAFDHLLYSPDTPRPTREHLVDQLTTILVSGFGGFTG
jgi:AcrR family transcriptional regulator